MIRPAVRPIVIASMANGIVAKAMEEPNIANEDMELFSNVYKTSENLAATWPSRIRNIKEFDAIKEHIALFTKATNWDNKPRHIQTYCIFLTFLLEEMREKVVDKERKAKIDAVLDAITELWKRYSQEREYDWCVRGGIQAALKWKKIME